MNHRYDPTTPENARFIREAARRAESDDPQWRRTPIPNPRTRKPHTKIEVAGVVYESMADAARALGVKPTTMRVAVRRRTRMRNGIFARVV